MTRQVPTLDEWHPTDDEQLKLDINSEDFSADSSREYVRTHPWIAFKLDLRNAPPKLWVLLGEAKARCEALGLVPLRPAIAETLHTLYLARGVHGTTAIEGNTLTLEQVQQIVERKLELPPSQEYLQREVANILVACRALSERAMLDRPSQWTARLIKSFNKTVLNGLDLKEDVVPGEIRTHSVGVARYLAAPARDCGFLLARLCDWLNSLRANTKGIEEEILRAVVAHIYLAWIHPFGDGNGRTARLMEFQILINAGIPTPAAHLMSNYYNLTRARYLQELDAASKSGGDLVPFLLYAIEGFVEQLTEQLTLVHGQHLNLAWRDYVHEIFAECTSSTDLRRRDLLLDLSWRQRPATKKELRTLSSRIEEAYRDKTDKTITRDLNWLMKKRLLQEGPDGFTARTAIILGFLPARSRRELEAETVKQERLHKNLKRRLKDL